MKLLVLLISLLAMTAANACSSGESLPEGAPPRQQPGDDWREIVTYAPRNPISESPIAFAITVPPGWIYQGAQGFDSLAGYLGPDIEGLNDSAISLPYTPHLTFDMAGNAAPVVPLAERDSLIWWEEVVTDGVVGRLHRPPEWAGYVGGVLSVRTSDRPDTGIYIAGEVENETDGMMLLTVLRSIRPCVPVGEVEPCELPAE